MFSVHLRIFLLAIITVIAVLIAFYNEYEDIQNELHVAKSTLKTTDDILSISELVHTLQSERGLTGAHLIAHDETIHDLFAQQRIITQLKWDELGSSGLLKGKQFSIDFPKQLAAMHKRIDSEYVKWEEIRVFYTSTIEKLLELIIVEAATLESPQNTSYELQALSYLANVRENLGLVRATISRGYSHGKLSIKELEFLSRHYGSYNDNLRVFHAISKTHFDKTGDSLWPINITKEVSHSITTQINHALASEVGILSGSTSIWWNHVTLLIDAMKETENAIFKEIKEHTSQRIEQHQKYLFLYTASMLIVLITLAILTIIIVRLFKEKEFLATTDLLTGVMNRRSFTAESENEISRSSRYNTPCSLIYCDLDLFKLINDEYGHAVGDMILKKFTATINENLRSTDFMGRWGGEEFIIFATETDLASAEKLAQKLRKKTMQLSVEPVKQLTCSFGVAQRLDNESFDELCERADKALYQAKESGRNNVCVSESINSDEE